MPQIKYNEYIPYLCKEFELILINFNISKQILNMYHTKNFAKAK